MSSCSFQEAAGASSAGLPSGLMEAPSAAKDAFGWFLASRNVRIGGMVCIECSMSKLDVAKQQIAYLKLWLGIVIVTDLSLVGWLLGNFRSAEWPLIVGDILAFTAVSWGCYALHTRIEAAIAKLEEL